MFPSPCNDGYWICFFVACHTRSMQELTSGFDYRMNPLRNDRIYGDSRRKGNEISMRQISSSHPSSFFCQSYFARLLGHVLLLHFVNINYSPKYSKIIEQKHIFVPFLSRLLSRIELQLSSLAGEPRSKSTKLVVGIFSCPHCTGCFKLKKISLN